MTSMITIYQANNPEHLPISLAEPELVLESELPNRLQTINDDIDELKDKTQNLNITGTTLSNISTINGIKIGVPHSWNFVYWDYAPFIPVCNAYSGATTIGHTLIFKDEYGADYAGAILSCNARGQLEIMGRFSVDMYKTDVGFALRQYKNTSMKFMKYDDTTSMLTLNSLDDTATFLGNVISPNITSLENKTQAIAYEAEGDKTIIANTTETGNLKVTYGIDTYTLSVGDSSVFTGSVTFQSTVNGYSLDTEFTKLQHLSTMDDITEVSGPFRASNLVGITYDDNLNTTFFSGNLSSLNISTLEDNLANLIGVIGGVTGFSGELHANDFVTTSGTLNDVIDNTQNITRILGAEEGDPSYTKIDGVSFQTTLERISNIEGTLTNINYTPALQLTAVTGDLSVNNLNGFLIGAPDIFRYDEVTPFIPVVGSNGVIEVGARIDFHRATNEEDYTVGLEVKSPSLLSVRNTNTEYAGDLEVGTTYYKNANGNSRLSSNQHSNIMWYNNAGTNVWIMDATSSGERWSTTRDNALAAFTRTTGMIYTADPALTTFSNNISAPNLTGLSYNNNLLLQTTDYTTATIISNHLHVNLNGMTYKPHLGIRAHKDDMTDTQEVMVQIGKNHTKAISFVYKYDDTAADCQYRLDFAGRTAYECLYGNTKTEHSIKGNLKVYGTVTENASKTITHYTMYKGDLQSGCFVETTGQLFRDPNSKLSPYENCITIVRQATTPNSKIIGVCTEIINNEVTDEYGNINQPAGKYCKYATHGDCLVKCDSATYTLGDILVPSLNGYAKKGNASDVMNCMCSMIPRLKVTSVETDQIDPECVVGFITI